MNKHELSELNNRLRRGAATNDEKKLLERHWRHAMNDRSAIDEMQPEEKDRLKKYLYLRISDRLGFRQTTRTPKSIGSFFKFFFS